MGGNDNAGTSNPFFNLFGDDECNKFLNIPIPDLLNAAPNLIDERTFELEPPTTDATPVLAPETIQAPEANVSAYETLIQKGLARLQKPGDIVNTATTIIDFVEEFPGTDPNHMQLASPLIKAIFHMVKYKYEVQTGRTQGHLGGHTIDTHNIVTELKKFEYNVKINKEKRNQSSGQPVPAVWITIAGDLKLDYMNIIGSPQSQAAVINHFKHAFPNDFIEEPFAKKLKKHR